VQLELKTRAVMQLALFIYMEKNQLDTRIQHIYLFPVKQILQTIQRFEIKKIVQAEPRFEFVKYSNTSETFWGPYMLEPSLSVCVSDGKPRRGQFAEKKHGADKSG
jgi:hypothetical protein